MEGNKSVDQLLNHTMAQGEVTNISFYCSSQIERIEFAAYIIVFLNLISVTMNILHIIVLSRLSSIKGTKYRLVLLHLTASDILYALMMVLTNIESEPSLFRKTPLEILMIYFLINHVIRYVKYPLMTVASLERYYALCHPMEYATSCLITKLHIWLAIVWVFLAISNGIFLSVHHDNLCYQTSVGISIDSSPNSYILNGSLSILVSLVAAGLLIRVMVELWKMAKRTIDMQDDSLKRASMYVIIVTVTYYSCTLPPFVGGIIIVKASSNSFLNHYISALTFPSLYGILNALVYGWITPAYRKEVRALLRCRNSVGIATDDSYNVDNTGI